MRRRAVLLSLPAFALSSAILSAGEDPLESAFAALSSAERRAAQEQLSGGGFYSGSIDGAFGPRTRQALVNAEIFIRDNSYGRTGFDLTTAAGASSYVQALARGDLAKYIWGEGDESDG